MTVDALIEWLESAKRTSNQSGQDISDYIVMLPSEPLQDGKVDHGNNTVSFWVWRQRE